MSVRLKIASYVFLILWASLFGFLAYSHYARLMTSNPGAGDRQTADVPALKNGESGRADAARYSKVLLFGAAFFAGIVGLGILVGNDVSQFVGDRTVKVLYNDEGELDTSPDYEAAEQEWADGNFLEAIRLLREYLNKNPREQHVALRIAEIYEKDLHNPLAAALEYEEVLKQKLPAEKWGWSAIHLCNLYFRLNQSEKAVVLLRRIVSEHSETAAAEKARKRLEQIEPDSTISARPIETESQVQAAAPEPVSEEPSVKLPPGFQPKKRA